MASRLDNAEYSLPKIAIDAESFKSWNADARERIVAFRFVALLGAARQK